MPNWKSVLGKWYPAKEYVVDSNAPRGQEVYSGPDRAAVEELKAAGVDFLGNDYHLNPDLIRQSRELGFKTVDEYLETMYGFDPKKAEALSKKMLAEDEITHKAPTRKNAIKEMGGGMNTARGGGSGEPDMYGGFGKGERGAPAETAAKVK